MKRIKGVIGIKIKNKQKMKTRNRSYSDNKLDSKEQSNERNEFLFKQ